MNREKGLQVCEAFNEAIQALYEDHQRPGPGEDAVPSPYKIDILNQAAFYKRRIFASKEDYDASAVVYELRNALWAGKQKSGESFPGTLCDVRHSDVLGRRYEGAQS